MLKINIQQLYEINARTWLHELTERLGKEINLLDVPDEIWMALIEGGFDWIWLMGAWQNTPLNMDFLNRHSGLIQEFNVALPGWEITDVLGSPYSIVQYDLHPLLGNPGDLSKLHDKLNQMGAKLMLDFVPNHFGIASPLARIHPEYFIHSSEKPKRASEVFSEMETELGTRWLAHGKDPYFPPWDDTFQVNYYNMDTWTHLKQLLLAISGICDGLRCDMAMLCVNDVIEKTWGWILQDQGFTRPREEFWQEAIEEVKSSFPDFIFLAEVYWDMEWKLQQLGFDYTYDKRFYDRLSGNSIDSIRKHLWAEKDFQLKSLRFIENHDEKRAITKFGRERSLAAAVIAGTVPGPCLYHNGQFEGRNVKIPVQLRRARSESVDSGVKNFYERLLTFVKQETLQKGEWSLNKVMQAWVDNYSWENLLAWQWSIAGDHNFSLVVVNYSPDRSQGKILIKFPSQVKDSDLLTFDDRMTMVIYKRGVKSVQGQGLFVDLLPFQAHIFNIRLL
ncbi:MAG: alpha-amylase family glycosyl hydrolase [Candidatus Hodarchaeales archaeon]|jgi:glycosidase